MDAVIDCVRSKGHTQIVKWDRVDGIDHTISSHAPLLDAPSLVSLQNSSGAAQMSDYDLGDDFTSGEGVENGSGTNYKTPDNFFHLFSSPFGPAEGKPPLS